MEPVLFRLESDGNKEPVSCSSPSAMYRGRHVKRALGPLEMSIQLHDHQPVPKREPVRAHLRCPWPVGLARLAEHRFLAEIKGKAPLDPITILVKASRQSGLFDRVHAGVWSAAGGQLSCNPGNIGETERGAGACRHDLPETNITLLAILSSVVVRSRRLASYTRANPGCPAQSFVITQRSVSSQR